MTPKSSLPRVGMVLDQPFPPDARVEREALCLAQAGYEVFLLSLVSEHYPVGASVHQDAFTVVRVDPDALRFPVLGVPTRLPYKGLIKALAASVLNWDMAWKHLIDQFVTQYRLDSLHVHDLRLGSTALAVAKKHHLPLVLDLHENYPALMELFKGRTNPARGQRQRQRWDRIQRDCVLEADQVITVSDEMKTILQHQGCPSNKITVLPNTVDIDKFLQTPGPDKSLRARVAGKQVLTYIGNINGVHRGVHTVLEAMPKLLAQFPNLFLILAGAYRPDYKAQLDEQIEAHHLAEHVMFTGRLDESEFRAFIEVADLCLCPHIANDQTNTGIPNKVYLYHLWEKAIVASNFKPMKTYMDRTQGGLCYPSGSADGLAQAVTRLLTDEALRRAAGTHGAQAVKDTYNWHQTAQALRRLYMELGIAHPPSGRLSTDKTLPLVGLSQ